MRTPTFATIALIASLTAGACSCANEPEPLPQPDHVLLIVVDTLRADHLSTYGYERQTSPVLDALAREAVVFESAVAQASWTLPSMVSMMTGRWLGEEAHRIPAGAGTLAEAFQAAGYATGAFIYNGLLNPENGFERGFQHFDYQDPPYRPDAPILAWIEQVRGGKSFTFVHLNEAHDPYGATDEKWPPGALASFMYLKDGLDEDRLLYYAQVSAAEGLEYFAPSQNEIETQIGAYDDDVAYSDARIGRLLDLYREAGLWERTAVVVASDHGEGLWTRLDFLQGQRLKAVQAGRPTLVDALQKTHGNRVNVELVRVPLVLRAPGLAAGRVAHVVENVDIAATLAELCDLSPPAKSNGESLLSLARDPGRRASLGGGFSHSRFVSSLIEGDLHLLVPTPVGECQFGLEVELYDVKSDPRERNNLAAQRPQDVARMRAEIEARMARGLHSDDRSFGPGTLEALNGLGYVDSGIVDTLSEEFKALSTDALLAKLESGSESANCIVRLELVRAFDGRELSAVQRARLAGLRYKEVSGAVKSAFDDVLGR